MCIIVWCVLFRNTRNYCVVCQNGSSRFMLTSALVITYCLYFVYSRARARAMHLSISICTCEPMCYTVKLHAMLYSEASHSRTLMYGSEGSNSGMLMYGSEGSHSGTLMYCSEGSHSGTLMYGMYCSEGSHSGTLIKGAILARKCIAVEGAILAR